MKLHDFFYWLMPWEPSLVVSILTAGAGLIYIRGCFKVHQGRLRIACFWLGLLFFYIVLHTQFDYYSEHAFFMHRLQHSVLHHAGPFLMAVSRPGRALWAGMNAASRRLLAKLSRTRPVRTLLNILNHPVMAVLLFCGLIVLWLIPLVHFIAMLDWRWYRVMNWSMAVNGLMFWNLALNDDCLQPARLTPGKRIAMMLAIIPPQILIGVVLFVTPRELYPIYSICGRVFEGMSPLADQQMGALVLWNAAMMSVVGVLVVMRREWLPNKSLAL